MSIKMTDNLIVQGNIKVKDNLNLSKPITEYRITHLIWDLMEDKVKIRVEYHNQENLVYTKDFSFDGKDEIDINKLIEQVKTYH